MTTKQSQENILTRFGFSFERGGAHIARTMMLEELGRLLAYIAEADTPRKEYVRAILEDNCLGKRSGTNRKLTVKHLSDLYSLDPSIILFRALRYFWQRDEKGRPLTAFLCAYARDPVLRISFPFILAANEGQPVSREGLEEYIESQEPGRFSKATLKSVSQNILSSWTKAGHLTGRTRKRRSRAQAAPGSVAYALLLGYLSGGRGEMLFETEHAKLLDCSVDRAMELAGDAARRGWIVLKRVGSVIEVSISHLLTAQEMEWIREQN